MEIGEYLTNVLVINDLSSIQYIYLEYNFSTSEPNRTIHLNIEAALGVPGSLVLRTNSGFWLFGTSADTNNLLPPAATIDVPGFIEIDNYLLAIKQQGTFEPSSFWKSVRSLTTSSSTYNGTPSPAFSTDSSIRTAQAVNSKAAFSNTALGLGRENGTPLSFIKTESSLTDPTFTDREIQEHFISAVLGTLGYHLSHGSGLVPLNARTLLVALPESPLGNHESTARARNILIHPRLFLVTLDVHLSSLGTLVVKAWPNARVRYASAGNTRQNLATKRTPMEGTAVILAPSGRIGRYIDLVSSDDLGPAAARDKIGGQHITKTALSGKSISRWKQRCINWLGQKGLDADALEAKEWFVIQITSETWPLESLDYGEDTIWSPGEKPLTIAWPASLCFQYTTPPLGDSTASTVCRGYDPLLFAEEWFTKRASREVEMSKRQAERESTAAAAKAQAEIDAKNSVPSGYSSTTLRRASLAGAVYPTPPDGIQPTVGATPSFEDNISTPGQPNPISLPTDVENVNIPKSDADYIEVNLWDANVIKKDPVGSGLDFNDSVNDNLFGDISADLFGENDITDADFSFFDEPDIVEETEPSGQGNHLGIFDDIHDSHSTIQTSAQADNVGDLLVPGVESDIAMTDAEPDENNGANDTPNTRALEASHIQFLNSNNHSVPHHTISNPSPPLSPELVFKRLSITGVAPRSTRAIGFPNQRVSAFGAVQFDCSFSVSIKKYGSHGRFDFPSVSDVARRVTSTDIPQTDYLSKRLKRKSASINIFAQTALLANELPVIELDDNESQSDIQSPSFSHIASPVSDQDDTSIATEDSPSIMKHRLKRKRGSEVESPDDDLMTSSFQDLKVDPENLLQISEPLDLLDLSFFEADPADWSLASFLTTPEPCIVPNSFSDGEYIASAQILAEQAISRTLHIPLLTDIDSGAGLRDQCSTESSVMNLIQENLARAVKSSFSQSKECTMGMFLDTQDLQAASQMSRMQSRPMPNPRSLQNSETARPSAIFNLAPPHLEVRRAESKLTVLPSAMQFWESLGLGPCNGGKDINAICVYPDAEGMADNVDAFLDHMRSAYESNRLGSHERFPLAELASGHFPMDFEDSSTLSVAHHQAILLRIKETSIKLGSLLAAGLVNETNIVVYYVYDSNSPELLLPICSAFHELFQIYNKSRMEDKIAVSNELVLQLIPLDFIASHTALVVPTPYEFSRVAMEVYDRCVDLHSDTSTPSIVLEQPLPRGIDFKLTSNPSASPLQENSCMHIAYAQSLDDRWVTAAWSDNTGTRQMTASYCLGRRDSPITTSLSDIAHEIWETTLEVISGRKINWRIVIAKCGVMEPLEIDFWKALAATESNAQMSLTLITVDTEPSLRLLPPSISIVPSTIAAQSSLHTTPVSTPQASIVSPEQSGNANTPARDAGMANAPTPSESNMELKIETDATLVDIADQTWGAVLSHRLNNSRSLLEINPTLASGYLIKRSGPAATDAPIVIEVNIVHSEANPRMQEALLREILGMYRGLATLARVRGCVDPAKDGRPWHIAAAEKGVKVLYMLM